MNKRLFLLILGALTASLIAAKSSVTAQPAAGKRAVAIAVKPSAAQFIKKGDRVDILVTFEREKGPNKSETVTATLLQNLTVLERSQNSLNLQASPLEAQFLALAENTGILSVAVREAGDKENNLIEMASFQKLFH